MVRHSLATDSMMNTARMRTPSRLLTVSAVLTRLRDSPVMTRNMMSHKINPKYLLIVVHMFVFEFQQDLIVPV